MKQLLSVTLLLSVLGSMLVAAGPSRTFGGYMDTEFYGKEGDNSKFVAHRVVLDFASQVDERILFNSEIEYEYGGDDGNDGVIKVEKAYVDFKLSDALVQRSGIIVVPFGHVNEYHDSDVRDTTTRPLYAKKIVPTTWSDTAFGVHGEFDRNDTEFKYEAYLVNGLNDGVTLNNGVRSARPSFKTDNNGDKAFVGRLSASPKLGTVIGTSYYRGAYDDNGENTLSIFGIDGFYKKGRYEFLAEYATVSLEDSGDLPSAMNGGYVEVRSHVLQDFLKRQFSYLDRPVITLVARYGFVDLDTAASETINRITVGANFRPIESLVYKIEYQQDEYDLSSNNSTDKSVNMSVALGF